MTSPSETESTRKKSYINEMFDGLDKELEKRRERSSGGALDRILKNIQAVKAARIARLAELDEKDKAV